MGGSADNFPLSSFSELNGRFDFVAGPFLVWVPGRDFSLGMLCGRWENNKTHVNEQKNLPPYHYHEHRLAECYIIILGIAKIICSQSKGGQSLYK